MPRFPKPPEGSWTQHYPDLGTGPVSYEDSISPDFYELERAAIFYVLLRQEKEGVTVEQIVAALDGSFDYRKSE